MSKEASAAIDAAIASLSPVSADILERVIRYEDKLEDIGKIFGISRERVRSIKEGALDDVGRFLRRTYEL
jgi:DNA-directed RNA polymerase sigma subunit (sigma70/sigma32)